MDKPKQPIDPMLPQHPKNDSKKGEFRAHVVKAQTQTELQEQGAKFDSELKKILRKGDVFGFRNFLSKGGRSLPTEMMLDTVKMETMLHQLTLTMPDLSDLHPRSQAWLDHHAFAKPRGLTLLQSSRLTPQQKKELNSEDAN